MAKAPELLLSQVSTRTFYEVARLRMMDQWWHWLILVIAIVAILALVSSLYRRDGFELKRPLRWTLILLRIAAFAGLLIFFLRIERRTEQRVVKNSRAVLMVDTSQSMGLTDGSSGGIGGSFADSSQSNDGQSNDGHRLAQVVETLKGGFLDALRAKHDVIIYRFDQSDTPRPITVIPRSSPSPTSDSDEPQAGLAAKFRVARGLMIVSGLFLISALVAMVAHWLLGAVVRNSEGDSWALLMSIACLLVAGTFYAVSSLRYPEFGWRDALVTASNMAEKIANDRTAAAGDTTNMAAPDDPAANIPWADAIQPSGLETRLGSNLQYVIDKERGGPIAGIAVFSDGNGNAGIDYREAIAAAQQAEIAIHLVGVGSDQQPTNAKLVDMEAPARVFPGDAFKVRGYVQAYGMAGRSLTIELASQSEETPGADPGVARYEDEQSLTLPKDGEVVAIEFETVPQEIGKFRYLLRFKDPPNDADASDDQMSAPVRVVDRKNRVLLLAGGPTRDYRFVRDLCYRDKDITSSVILQSSPPGSAQEADEMLDEFPTTPEDLFEYDCLVAFDPDWEAIDDRSIELLDRWVAEKAGGLIVVAGPVFTPEWTTLRRERRATQTLKALYPVTFFSRTVMRLSRGISRDTPLPLNFTEDGRVARFLWLAESASESERIWADFPGFYAAFPVSGWKPGATPLATVSEPGQPSDDATPLIVEQFYGAGRVIYLGSGEMWRLRMLEVDYFEQLYTKWIRQVSSGRLLRDSSRGVLMVSKDRAVLGETVTVRASLSDAQFRPLERDFVQAELVTPSGLRQPLRMDSIKDAARSGTFSGQFTAIREGPYRVDLVVPDADELEILSREILVRIPELEIESPQRNDAVMSEIAAATGGQYLVGLDALRGAEAASNRLVQSLIPQDQETYLPGVADRDFQQRLMGWLMTLICGALTLEWLFRRLNKLA